MIITIDGPGGAGKSTAARELARRLGFEFLDTGAMYRAVTLAALRAGLDLRDQDALAHLMNGLRLDMPPGQVLLGGEDVSDQLRTHEVTQASGLVADSPVVRRRLGEMQRAVAAGRCMVCEGRDQGTIVFPDAFCKFFLSAAPEERGAAAPGRDGRARRNGGPGRPLPGRWRSATAATPPAPRRRCGRRTTPSWWIAPA